MNCSEAREDLVRLLKRELSAEEESALLAHLSGCRACSAEKASIAATLEVAGGSGIVVPPPHLKAAVLGAIEAERLGPALRYAIPAVPDASLRMRTLTKVAAERTYGLAPRRISNALLAAAAVIALLVVTVGWLRIQGLEDDVAKLRAANEDVAGRLGPAGHELQTFALSADTGTVEGRLTHYRHDNYRLTLEVASLDPTPPDTYYGVWLRGRGGTVPIGTFRLKSPDRFVVNFAAAVDPAEYPEVVVTLEPDDGDPALTGETIASGSLDTSNVHHGVYDD
jgi:hypothetical protein